MGYLVRYMLIWVFVKLVLAKPQHRHLQEQENYNLKPISQPEFEYPSKDPGKRTVGFQHHYLLGKHTGIHPLSQHGLRYIVGYNPINIRYLPTLRPLLRPSWRPMFHPVRQYLPLPKPIHDIDQGWKPLIPVTTPLPQPQVPPSFATFPEANPQLHNYFYFQTPVTKPRLPVLPLGASFPAHVLSIQSPQIHQHPLLLPTNPHDSNLLLSLPTRPIQHHPLYLPANLPQQPAPVHHPFLISQFHQPPTFLIQENPPASVDYHGHHNLVPNTHLEPRDPVQHSFINPENAIQPGHTDLQVPEHLPHHPQFKQFYPVQDSTPEGHFNQQFPPLQDHGNNIRPSISLEPPLGHRQN